jgi:GntR family transcriptional regulator / MocR family aminotransferase
MDARRARDEGVAMTISKEVFFLDPGARGSKQSQIQQIVARAILSGRFRPGDRLPSSRSLARHLGVSRITVTLAFSELVAEDYLAPRNRSGYYVSENAPIPIEPPPSGPERDVVDWSRALRRKYSGYPAVEKPPDWRSYPYPFVYGQADPDLFDQTNWRICAHGALSRKEFDSLTLDYAGRDDPELVEFIASHTLPRRGILARREQILITLGAQNALWLAAQVLCGPGTNVAHEDPVYAGVRDILRAAGGVRHPAPVDESGLDPATLVAPVDVVFVTPSHHSPTTVTMPMSRREKLLRLASARNFLIVEDDYEFEMSFLARPSPALKSLDEEGRVIYAGSFSKSVFPGLRLGYLVGSEPFIREARALRTTMLRHPPGHMQRTTAHFLAKGHYAALIRRMRAAYDERHATALKAFAEHGLQIAGRAAFGGSSFWMRAPETVDTEVLARRLRGHGVLIDPGHPFFEGRAPPRNFFRLGYSSIPSKSIPEGSARIAHAIEELDRTAGGNWP